MISSPSQLKGFVKENKFYVYETEKITHKASDTAQYISSCSVLSPEIVMHDAFNVILWTSDDICIIVHDNIW